MDYWRLPAKEYYEAGVKAAMDEWSLFPGFATAAVTDAGKNGYLLQPGIAYNGADALNLSIHNTGLNPVFSESINSVFHYRNLLPFLPSHL